MKIERIQKIEKHIKSVELEIDKIRKNLNKKIKALQSEKVKLTQKLNVDILKMMEGMSSEKIITAGVAPIWTGPSSC